MLRHCRVGANLLHLKPCIAVRNGDMGVVKKHRGSFERCWMHAPPARDMAIVVHHAAIRTLEEDVRFRASHKARTGCGVARHCVPNTIGSMLMNQGEAPLSIRAAAETGAFVYAMIRMLTGTAACSGCPTSHSPAA